MKKNLFFIASGLIGGMMALGIYTFIDKDEAVLFPSYSTPVHSVNYSGLPVEGALDFTVAAEQSINAVVHVKTQVSVNPAYNPWQEFFGYEQGESQVQMGTGSGVIISGDGYIVTNNHVVEGAQKVQVTLNNNKNYDAEIVGADPSTDIAILKISEKGLPFLAWGNSEDVRVGQWVLAVGNPFDLTSTVTAGIVSAKARNINLLNPGYNREIFPIESFIQTDAAVNPGNSGGALVNTSGELVGINTAIASRTGSYAGYSFAVPATIAKKVAADLIEFGTVQRAFIGVSISDVTEEIAKENGLKEVSGVYVSALTVGGAAVESGIKEGDIIVKVNDRMVRNVPELQEQVSKYRPGDKVNVNVWRKGKMQTSIITLKNKAGNTEIGSAASAPEGSSVLGAKLSDPSEKEKTYLGITGGAKVYEITTGILKDVGLQQGFIITKIDNLKIVDATQAETLLTKKIAGQMLVIEGYYPNGTKAYYEFRR
ncbi:MAG: trypsin-like peptidase domain-containing protein [Flavobacteriales bacterium]|nr:trypsin-like peptidase domain-containing protein [Flavobacteriales bacterium]